MRILGRPSATRELVLANCVPLTQDRFLSAMFPALWSEAARYHVDPVGVVAQAIKETGGGAYKGKVSPKAHNTCGLKIKYTGIYGPATDGDEPAAHATFPSWRVGARAHVQHVRAYAGWPLEPDELVVDPRYEWVIGKYAAEDWSDMNGLWAKPGPTYGTDIEALMARLVATS